LGRDIEVEVLEASDIANAAQQVRASPGADEREHCGLFDAFRPDLPGRRDPLIRRSDISRGK
jgi:hypothetical protein